MLVKSCTYRKMCAVDIHVQYVNVSVNRIYGKEMKDKHNIAIGIYIKLTLLLLTPTLLHIQHMYVEIKCLCQICSTYIYQINCYK